MEPVCRLAKTRVSYGRIGDWTRAYGEFSSRSSRFSQLHSKVPVLSHGALMCSSAADVIPLLPIKKPTLGKLWSGRPGRTGDVQLGKGADEGKPRKPEDENP